MLKDKYKKTILDICNKHLKDPYELFLFGSRARGDEAFHSDIDLAIKTRNPKKDYIISLIAEDFEESTIPYKIDFLDLDQVDKKMKESIYRDGIILNG